jgi:hypothetical protein
LRRLFAFLPRNQSLGWVNECNRDFSPITQKKPVYSDTGSPVQTPGRFVDLVVVTAQAAMRVTAKALSDTAFRVSTRNNLT